MNKVFLIVLSLMALGVIGIGVLTSLSVYTYEVEGRPFVVGPGGGPISPEQHRVNQQQRNRDTGLLPKAVVKQSTFDFGIMDPHTNGKHVFVIRNGGKGNLELATGKTTCKCTLSKLSDGTLAPGEQAEVELSWNTGKNESFSHRAEIATNDPLANPIELRVTGMVRTLLGATIKELVFAEIAPDESASMATVVYSQSMSEFSIVDADSTIKGLTWMFEPADAETLERLKAKSGYHLRVTTPSDLPSGPFSGELRLLVKTPPKPTSDLEGDEHAPGVDAETIDGEDNGSDRANQEGEPQSGREMFELTVTGKVVRRLSVYGAAIDATGNIDLGVLDEGQGKKIRLLMKVRDAQSEIPVKSLEVEPQFVKVNVVPYGDDGKPGLNYLDVEVPTDAPQCQHHGSKRGRIQFTFDHPRIERLDLGLSFAVVPSGL